MTRIIFAIVTILLFSCAQKEEIIEQTWPDGAPKLVKVFAIDGEEKALAKETEYYENGQIKIIGEYNSESQRTGQWHAYYEDAKPWSECEYRNGLKHGKNTVWFSNGHLRYEGKYENDKQAGIWKFWDENGALVKEVEY
ncbi:MAG: hypothetical protein COA57_05925 [Flavobacteriales bacterium]|nr:hypothetical protein [Bacteroidales bacterium AH-315-I05]PCJ86547.1 MAG: hypothetical protein COA57_05925 [Flavobacteriales bacterium]